MSSKTIQLFFSCVVWRKGEGRRALLVKQDIALHESHHGANLDAMYAVSLAQNDLFALITLHKTRSQDRAEVFLFRMIKYLRISVSVFLCSHPVPLLLLQYLPFYVSPPSLLAQVGLLVGYQLVRPSIHLPLSISSQFQEVLVYPSWQPSLPTRDRKRGERNKKDGPSSWWQKGYSTGTCATFRSS